jgi:phosphomannomutase
MPHKPPTDLIVSVSGIRGVVGQALTAETVTRFAAAYGAFVEGKKVLVSRDSRPSGEMLRHAVVAGLLGAGCSVQDIGIAPTPTCGFAVGSFNAAGAIQITAIHNPAPWKGLKMFGADGAVLSAASGAIVRMLYETGTFQRAAWNGIGEFHVPPDVQEEHARVVCDQVSVAAVAACGFRVFLDANGGAGGPLGVKLLNDLGCEVCEYECQPTGHFLHEPEPIPAHLVDVAPWVSQNGCAAGFVLDPDADRLALIDETGMCVSEEATLALAVKYRLKHHPGPVVINMSTSRMSEDLARDAGCDCIRSAVGEANVVAKMNEIGAVIGGEGNGGVIDPRVGWVRDPFIGMALILSLMAEEKKPLSQLIAELPQYSMLKTKYVVPRDKLVAALAALEKRWPETRINRDDGLRLDGADWWLHVRGSNTEPVVRVIAEAPDAGRAKELCDEAGFLVAT